MQQLDFLEYHRHTLPLLLAAGRATLLKGKKLPVLGLSVAGQSMSFSYRCDKKRRGDSRGYRGGGALR